MTAYKFRHVCAKDSTAIRYLMEIIQERKLWCADWTDLNDPSEGHYLYGGERKPDEIRKMLAEKTKYRICSLCKRFDNPLMWAHYAGGFKGIAIEVDLPDPCECGPVVEVRYLPKLPQIQMGSAVKVHEAARTVLSTKLKYWKYEEEVRILHTQEHFKLNQPVRRVILGSRVAKALSRMLTSACNRMGTEIAQIDVSRGTIKVAGHHRGMDQR